MPSIPELTPIQHNAILKTEHERSLTLASWSDGLPQLEEIVTKLLEKPQAGFSDDHALKIFDAIANNSGFMLIVVFSPDRRKCTILPAPEVFSAEGLRKIGTTQFSANSKDTRSVVYGIVQALNPRQYAGDYESDVVVIHQNLGPKRNFGNLSVGFLDLDHAKAFENGRIYLQWIEQTKLDLKSRSR